MKTLQKTYTTSDQSKRLLEIGVPVNSADCVHTLKTNRVFFMQNGKVTEGYLSLYKAMRGEEAEPCWSADRLMEIYDLVGENAGKCISTNKTESKINNLVRLYEENITLLDFSKLEG